MSTAVGDPTAAFSLGHVTVTFPDRPTPSLSGLDLEVGRGEHVLLCGPSGGGKSTLLHLLTGVVPQSVHAEISGQVRVLGRDPAQEPVPRLALSVGWLGQDPASNACLPRVTEEVALPLENRGVPNEQIGARVTAALRSVGAEHLAARRTSSLSGGEQQRVALAAVLAGEPEVLLLDEPTSMLDPVAAARVHALLAEHSRRRTVVLVEHRLDAGWLPDRSVVLDLRGRVVADGPTDQVLRRWEADGAVPRPVLRPQREPGPVALRLRGASFCQGGTEVVRDIDLALRRGQVTAVVGANGSGKSSLLLGAAGFLVGDTPAEAGGVALVFQRPEHQLVSRTVLGELSPPGRRGMTPGRTATATAMLERFGLGHLSGADPFRLSGGQQRRLSVAAMAVLGRPVLLLDEPTAGLDAEQSRAVRELLDGLAAGGTAIGLATHDLDLARRLADQVVVLAAGQVVATGGPEVLDDPGLLLAAGLLVGAEEGLARR